MKRRTLLSLGIGGLAFAVGSKYILASADQATSTREGGVASIPENSDPLLRFVAVGDVGTGGAPQYAVSQAMSQYWEQSPYPLVLLTGDNIYEDGEISRVKAAFEQPYAKLLSQNVKFYATLGNHDVRTDRGRDQIAYPGYNMSSRYYSFVRPPVHFFALDTNQKDLQNRHRDSPWQRQLQWLKRELSNSQSPWKVVYAHHPVYSSGYHGSSPILRRTLSPILKEYGVQLYVNGHDHNYEITQPIEGITYVTSGNGARLRPIDRSRWMAYATSVLGFTAFEVYADQMVVKAIDTQNNIYDQGQVFRVHPTSSQSQTRGS